MKKDETHIKIMDYRRKISNIIEDEGLLNSSSISSTLEEQTITSIEEITKNKEYYLQIIFKVFNKFYILFEIIEMKDRKEIKRSYSMPKKK